MNKKNADLLEQIKDNEKLQKEIKNHEAEKIALSLHKEVENNIEKCRKDIEQTITFKTKENNDLQREYLTLQETQAKKINEYKNQINSLQAELDGQKID